MYMTSMEFSITWCDIIPPLQMKKLRLTVFIEICSLRAWAQTLGALFSPHVVKGLRWAGGALQGILSLSTFYTLGSFVKQLKLFGLLSEKCVQ